MPGGGWLLAVGLAAFEFMSVGAVAAVPWFLTRPMLNDPQAGILVADVRRFLYWVCGVALAPWLLTAALCPARIRIAVLGLFATAPAWASLIALPGRRLEPIAAPT
jgi:hypothetical protein